MTSLRRLVGLALLFLAPAALRAQSNSSGTTSVSGTVEDSIGAPIVGAQILAVAGTSRAVTDSFGRFLLTNLRRGTVTLEIRRLGFEPLTVPLDLPLADDESLAIELRGGATRGGAATDLAPVLVKAERVSPRLAATGYLNRKQFSGAPPEQYVTRADFDKLRPIDLGQMLRRMSARAARCGDGVIFLDGVLMGKPIADAAPVLTATTLALLSNASSTTALEASRKATQDIARTGSPIPKPQALDMIPLNWIEGMEVYASAAQIPNEYRAAFREARCVILLWTR